MGTQWNDKGYVSADGVAIYRRGSITDIFNASVWMGIKKVMKDQINANANVA